MKPSSPERKAASINFNSAGSVSGNSSFAPARKSAEAFGSVDKGVYKHPAAPVSPNTVPVNDKDAGNGPGNVRHEPAQHMGYPLKGGE